MSNMCQLSPGRDGLSGPPGEAGFDGESGDVGDQGDEGTRPDLTCALIEQLLTKNEGNVRGRVCAQQRR